MLLGWSSRALGIGGKFFVLLTLITAYLSFGQHDGQQGVELMFKILYDDFKRCMQLTGCKSVSEIRPELLAIVNAYGPLARL